MAQIRADAIRRICCDLDLPPGGPFTQDWEYELPEEFRTSVWLQRYLAAYNREEYGAPEKQVIMTLLLDCLNDRMEAGDESVERLWGEVAQLLSADQEMHSSLIEHWSLPGEPLEDAFALTARIRGIRNEVAAVRSESVE